LLGSPYVVLGLVCDIGVDPRFSSVCLVRSVCFVVGVFEILRTNVLASQVASGWLAFMPVLFDTGASFTLSVPSALFSG